MMTAYPKKIPAATISKPAAQVTVWGLRNIAIPTRIKTMTIAAIKMPAATSNGSKLWVIRQS